MKPKKIICEEQDTWERIEEHMKDPDYIKAVYEFIRQTS